MAKLGFVPESARINACEGLSTVPGSQKVLYPCQPILVLSLAMIISMPKDIALGSHGSQSRIPSKTLCGHHPKVTSVILETQVDLLPEADHGRNC